MFGLELVATFFSILCVYFSIRRSIWCWPTGIVGVAAYMLLFYEFKLYADMGLQVVYLAQSLYGWYYWKQKQGESANEPQTITHLSIGKWLLVGLSVLVLWLLLWQFLIAYTDGDIPQWDALATALSLVAQALLAWKYIENWSIWILADALLIPIFMYKQLYLSVFTYSLFLIMAVIGWMQWKKDKVQTAV